MAYERKTYDEWQLLSNYGYGWEVELTEETKKEILQRLKEYRENTNGDFRIKKIRVKKEGKQKMKVKNMTIKQFIKEKDLKVVSIKGEVFTNQYITLANNKNVDTIKEKYLSRELKRIERDEVLGLVLIS